MHLAVGIPNSSFALFVDRGQKNEAKQKGNDKLRVRGFRNQLNEGHWDQPLDCCLPNKVNEMMERRWAY